VIHGLINNYRDKTTRYIIEVGRSRVIHGFKDNSKEVRL